MTKNEWLQIIEAFKDYEEVYKQLLDTSYECYYDISINNISKIFKLIYKLSDIKIIRDSLNIYKCENYRIRKKFIQNKNNKINKKSKSKIKWKVDKHKLKKYKQYLKDKYKEMNLNEELDLSGYDFSFLKSHTYSYALQSVTHKNFMDIATRIKIRN